MARLLLTGTLPVYFDKLLRSYTQDQCAQTLHIRLRQCHSLDLPKCLDIYQDIIVQNISPRAIKVRFLRFEIRQLNTTNRILSLPAMISIVCINTSSTMSAWIRSTIILH